ncbi:hypothetical protein GGR52DRAFT_559902 [Hypoxylon sp. FL1284]|nr:hypothetical protein GGR52DRAFT_559902 [Hypoxylon sp. FL1284]
MGFTTGFTGGVTLTLSAAYLTVLAHQRHREHQSAILRQQTRLLTSIVDPLPAPAPPPTRSEAAAASRERLVERAKDRWNAELEGAVRRAQATDWDEVREGVETAVARLWARAFDRSLDAAEAGETKARDAAGKTAAAAKSAYADAKARTAEAVGASGDKTDEGKGSIFGSIGKVFGRS